MGAKAKKLKAMGKAVEREGFVRERDGFGTCVALQAADKFASVPRKRITGGPFKPSHRDARENCIHSECSLATK